MGLASARPRQIPTDSSTVAKPSSRRPSAARPRGDGRPQCTQGQAISAGTSAPVVDGLYGPTAGHDSLASVTKN